MKRHNQALQATPDGAVCSAVADEAFWLGVPELTSEVIRQRFFQDFLAGFLKGLLPRSTRSKSVTKLLPFFLKAAS